jgi:hypothetical protein
MILGKISFTNTGTGNSSAKEVSFMGEWYPRVNFLALLSNGLQQAEE